MLHLDPELFVQGTFIGNVEGTVSLFTTLDNGGFEQCNDRIEVGWLWSDEDSVVRVYEHCHVLPVV
jgi:hypothetical protein